jgi:hypothetical protein
MNMRSITLQKLYFYIPHHHRSTNSTTLIFQSMLPQIQPQQDDSVSYTSPIKYVSLRVIRATHIDTDDAQPSIVQQKSNETTNA